MGGIGIAIVVLLGSCAELTETPSAPEPASESEPVAPPLSAAFGPFCGGIANIACPGLGRCADDPRDDCTKLAGDADCGGVCVCLARPDCSAGTHFDDSPALCRCVPDACPENPCILRLCPVDTRCVRDGCAAACVAPSPPPCLRRCPPGKTCPDACRPAPD